MKAVFRLQQSFQQNNQFKQMFHHFRIKFVQISLRSLSSVPSFCGWSKFNLPVLQSDEETLY